MVSAEELKEKITERVGASYVTVTDLGGGCGDKFEVFIVSEKFDGLKLIQRQRLVNEALAEEMKEIHAFVFKKTITPAQYEEWKAKEQQ